MKKTLAVVLLSIFLPLLGLLTFFTEPASTAPKGDSGTLQKMIVSKGTVSMDLDLARLGAGSLRSKSSSRDQLIFDAQKNSFFTIMVFEGKLRGSIPGSMPIIPRGNAALPGKLGASFDNLVVERSMPTEQYELSLRDGKTGFTFFNIEGHQYSFEPKSGELGIDGGRLLVSKQFALDLGRADLAGTVAGSVSIKATMRAIEVTQLVDGKIISDVMPAIAGPEAGSVPGPDVVVGDVYGLAQFGSSGSLVGLALGTVSCNYGQENLNWFALPNNDHPVIPQNLYRMSGGTLNQERFEQIGQSNVKHAFTALTQNICGLGCNGVGGSHLGSGCSDPYSASLNAGPNLGSRAWINPFSGAFPRGDSVTPPNNHSGHSHNGISHRILTEISDLDPSQNAGATYWAEGQYITPHEYAWCQSNPTECNMYNNVSYRQYSVSGSGSSFSFSPVGSTVREKPAVAEWPGATYVGIEPDPGNDGVAAIAYKVTETSPGVWHYEYAVYNQNLDRAIRSFAVAIGAGSSINNVGFHAPPQQPGWSADGTVGDAGFSSAPWTPVVSGSDVSWTTETYGQNQNANAIRWGTMYNFRFDSTSPPEMRDATVGFFKTGDPVVVQVQAPGGPAAATYSVSGQVMTASGRPLSMVGVEMTDTQGHTVVTFTNGLGYFWMGGIAPGTGYTLQPVAKGYTFDPQVIDISDNVSGMQFLAVP